MKEKLSDILLEKTGASKILEFQLIQELWSGYGELQRVILNNGSVIVKFIEFPKENNHPRGWNSEIGHQRKVFSYEVERTWYQNFNSTIPHARLPRHIASGTVENAQYLILEDLKMTGYKPCNKISWEQVKECLSWLASFHHSFLGATPSDLWSVGTYWHLDTRPDELLVLKKNGDDEELLRAASIIDKKLNSAINKSIVHGDAKLANFLFNKEGAAAVDFQYVGGGVGVKDLAYFLSSIYNEDELHKNEEKCLDYYFSELKNHDVEAEWRSLYPLAWCDFYRFLKGWSPGHYKLNSYCEKMKRKTLECL